MKLILTTPKTAATFKKPKKEKKEVLKNKMEYQDCQFLEPLTFQNIPPAASTDFWQFSKLQCEISQQQTITDGTSTFYLLKNVNYGDLLILFFLILFLFAGIFKFLWNFWITPYIRFRKMERRQRNFK